MANSEQNWRGHAVGNWATVALPRFRRLYPGPCKKVGQFQKKYTIYFARWTDNVAMGMRVP